ncbi:phosphotransferase [Kiloniella sp.]|uniref:phosphotransferase n=1 Tax=Kiloniella sp. TaxID=1938587 RepID=UPI003B01167F
MSVSVLHKYDTTEAELLFQEFYGLSGKASVLPSERDQNFRITSEEGRDYVLKLYAPETDAEWLDAQDKLLEQLSKRDPSLPLPRVLPNNKGSITDKFADPQVKPVLLGL